MPTRAFERAHLRPSFFDELLFPFERQVHQREPVPPGFIGISHFWMMYSAAMWTWFVGFVTAWVTIMASWFVSDRVPAGALGAHPTAWKIAIAGATAGAISMIIDLSKRHWGRVSAR